MKQKILILLFLFVGVQVHGQTSGAWGDLSSKYYPPDKRNTVDTCQLQVIYTFQFARDTISQDRYTDQFALQIGKRVTHFYSLFAERVDSIWYDYVHGTKTEKHKNKHADGMNPSSWMEPFEKELYWEFYTDYPSFGTLTYRRAIAETQYEYQEPIQMMFWNIQSEQKTILGYQCQLATTTFRGRTYDAWFTYQIPTSKGPWKFNRLPGLILEVKDRDNYFHFTAIGIEQRTPVKPIYTMTHQYRTVSRDQMMKLERRLYLDPIGLTFDNIGGREMTIQTVAADGSVRQVKRGDVVAPYIPPMELE